MATCVVSWLTFITLFSVSTIVRWLATSLGTNMTNDYQTDAVQSPKHGHLHGFLACLIPYLIIFFLSKYNRLLAGYMGSVGTDMTIDLSPPKALYIDVRVKQDYGELETPDGEVKQIQIMLL